MAENNCRLLITNQPREFFRFRTITDAYHGKLKGIDGNDISVKLEGFMGNPNNVIVLCTIYQFQEPFHMYLHPNLLMKFGRERSNTIIQYDPLNSKLNNDGIATFPGMTIVKTRRNSMLQALNEKRSRIRLYKPNYNLPNIEMSNVDLNNIRLCFEAFEREDNQFLPICDPIFSNNITNNSSPPTGIAWCCENCIGEASGNNNLIIVWQSPGNFRRDDIKVRFFEIRDDITVWEAYANINYIPYCSHSLIITTPPYRNANIAVDTRVFFELCIDTIGRRIISDVKQFIYKSNTARALAEI